MVKLNCFIVLGFLIGCSSVKADQTPHPYIIAHCNGSTDYNQHPSIAETPIGDIIYTCPGDNNIYRLDFK